MGWTLRRLLPVAGWTGLILFVATRPSSSFIAADADLGGAPRSFLQYPYHVGVFFVLALLLRRCLPPAADEEPRATAVTLLGALAVSALSELIQFWAPTRTPALRDLGLDFLGASLGLAAGAVWEWRSARSAPGPAPDRTEVA